MKGITIGLGDEHEFYANHAAERAKRYLGLDDVYVVRDIDINHIKELKDIYHTAYRAWATKFFLFEITGYDRFIYFDCDVAFMSTPPESQLEIIHNEPNFLAVRDRPYNLGLKEMEELVGIPYGTYINAGLFVANRKAHLDMFNRLRAFTGVNKHVLHTFKFFDQDFLNSELFRIRNSTHTRWLHRFWNSQDWTPGWGIVPYASHTSGNYPVYRGEKKFPELPQALPSEGWIEGDFCYTDDGFICSDHEGRIVGMYHCLGNEVIKYTA